jgi:CheY-like chemotaxis protein
MAQILIVDDQVSVRGVIRALLEAAGHTVVDTGNGKEALRLLGPDFDLLVTDVMMPDMDGLELIRHVRREFGDMPILTVTSGWGGDGPDLLSVARKLGSDRTLGKSMIQSDLVATVTRMLAAARRASPGLD